MPVYEIEVGEDGLVKTFPEELQPWMDSKMAEAKRRGQAQGEKDAERRFKPYMSDPAELETLRQKAQKADEYELKDAEREKRYEEAIRLREKAHAEATAAERTKTEAALARVRASIGKSIRAAAASAGARQESLGELERLLGADIDLDDALTEFVRDGEGRPRVDDKGQRVTIEGFVADYLKTHPHHVAAPPVKGGKAPGGATLAGRPPVVTGDARSEARARVSENPSTQNIASLLRAAVAKTDAA